MTPTKIKIRMILPSRHNNKFRRSNEKRSRVHHWSSKHRALITENCVNSSVSFVLSRVPPHSDRSGSRRMSWPPNEQNSQQRRKKNRIGLSNEATVVWKGFFSFFSLSSSSVRLVGLKCVIGPSIVWRKWSWGKKAPGTRMYSIRKRKLFMWKLHFSKLFNQINFKSQFP